MNLSPLHYRTLRLTRSRLARRVSPFSLLAFGALSQGALVARADAPVAKASGKPRVLVAQAQTNQENRNQPAAIPNDQPNKLQLPGGPTVGPPSTAPNGEGQDNSTTLTQPGTPTTATPDALPIIGNVNEAEGREIAEVRVVGNRIVNEPAILAQVRTQRGSAFASRQVELDRARIDSLGFFASVQAQVAPDINDPQKVVVTYIVTENRVVTGFRFVGNTLLKSEDLQKAVTSKPGVVLNRSNVSSDVAAIQKTYSDKGFAVLVQSASQEESGQIVFTLVEAKLSRIELSGLKKTRPSLVRRLIRTPLNTPFDASKLRRDLSTIYDTGFFEDATFRIDDDPNTSGAVIATFLLKEKRSGTFNVGLGFDSRSKISGFAALGENNLGGSGKRAAASIEVGSQRNYQLSYGNPFVGNRLSSYDVSIYSSTLFREPRIFQNLTGTTTANTTFSERRQGGRVTYATPLDPDRNSLVSVGYRNERARLETTDIAGLPVAPPLINGVPFVGSGTVSAASVGFVHDRRDSRLEPTRGGRESLSLEQGFKFLSGTSNFTKLDLDLRRYMPLSKPKSATELPKIVIAGRVVLGRSLNQLPAFEQYFIGGPDTVRGYDSDYQFGDNQVYGNLELRYRFNRQIQGVLFSDAGSSFGGQFTSNKSADVLTSVGAGIRLQTPIGPVRLDYGIGRNGGVTHFAIGQSF